MPLSPTSGPGGSSFSGGTITGNFLILAPASGLADIEANAPVGGSGAYLNISDNSTGAGLQVVTPEGLPQWPIVYTDAASDYVFRINPAGAVIFRAHAAPTDLSLTAGDCALWFDQTNGAAKLMVKAKQADGTVKTGSLALA